MTVMAGESTSAITAFREPLLLKTVEWCVKHSPFYRERFGPAVAAGFNGLEDLHRLPILFRDDAYRNADRLLCQRVQPACVQYTTGTTGQLLHLYRSPDEIAFVGDFFSRRVMDMYGAQPVRPLWLSLASAYHGSPTPIPGWPFIVSAGVYDRTQAQQARALLEREYDFPGVEREVSAIVGGDILIKALTAYLIDEGVDPSTLGVRHLVITGGYLSSARKQLLARLWNANVSDRYSMSEVFGGASQIGTDGPFVFDTEVIPEVVHPRTLEPIRKGVGALVLTGLYPFMQMMPFVRYYTGDLVEIVNADAFAVRLVGRERRSVIDASGEEVVPLLLSAPLVDIMEMLPDVAMQPRFHDLQSGAGLELAGKMHFSVTREEGEGGRDTITLRAGLRYAPWMFPRRAIELSTWLRGRLYERFPALRERVLDGRITLEIALDSGDRVPAYNAK